MYLFINVIFDLFLLSSYSFSLNLGFIGAGISSLVSSFLFMLIPLCYLFINKIFTNDFSNINQSKNMLSIYFKNFIISAIETLVRNVVFSYMVIGMMSKIGGQGIYWQANSFIWTWMLLPVSIISQFIKETNSNVVYSDDKKKDLKIKLWLYYTATLFVIVLWSILIPCNEPFMKNILNYNNSKEVQKIVMILFGFYICYSLSSVIDAIFISNGRLGLFLIQTLIVNLTIYPIYFILYKSNIWIPNVESIALMFGFGLLLDFVIDVILYCILLRFNDPYSKITNIIKNKIHSLKRISSRY